MTRKMRALGAALVLACAPATASAQETVGPYFMVVVDNSGSMTSSTGSGTNSCGLPRNRMSDAKCVLQDVVNGYGEAVFGLERFRHTCSGSCSSTSCDDSCGCSCSLTCNSTAGAGEILVPITSGNQSDVLEWVDYSCATCSGIAPGTQPELHASGNTPLAGALRAAREYYQGLDSRFPTSPIASDSFSGCRPYSVILLTDGDETCSGNPSTAATELRTTTVGGTTYDIHTYVIGFGISPGDAQTESIATAGGTDAPGGHRAFYASDETSLALAFSQIMADSILYETCNGVDDDCDTRVDEGFTLYCDRPGGTAPPPTLCTDPGETVCDGVDDNCNGSIDEGLLNACGTCGAAPTETCNGADDDCDGVIDEGDVCGGCVPGTEICNNADDDCDGRIDEGVSRACGTSTGECTTGTQVCTTGTWGACSGVGPTAETCDGLDNNCDGLIDGISRPCGSGVGECQQGSELCTSGSWGACSGATGPSAERCDGLDNDCDASTDEGDPGGGGSCGSGIGECVEGTRTCMGGSLVCAGGVSPSPESCDGTDEDCDGSTDEGVPTMGACGTSTGACSEGALTCSGGTFVCLGAVGPTGESCNGIDDDCDASTDEGDPGGGASCGPSAGACSPGTTTCAGGALSCIGGVSPAPETCDGADEDCDGSVDEGNPGGGATCGSSTGACVPGSLTCSGGALVCTGGVGSTAESCDASDNDCDGFIDEGDPGGGGTCGTSTGACSTGTLACTSGALICSGAVGPTAESCNGADDDCDGSTDEGDPGGGAACGSSTGTCSPGTRTCSGGALTCSGGVRPAAESCDTLDNDCDGVVDEGNPDGGAACGSATGECNAGTLTCSSGALLCTGARGPSAEVCDGLDNDCDASTDEGDPGGGGACGSSIGACAPGTLTCAGGALTCTGGVSPMPESCDGTDEDCDGNTDEAVPTMGTCGSSVGECDTGVNTCVGGSFTCVGDRGPVTEICDGRDNDCDASTDEGNPGGGVVCGTSTGACETGLSECVGGSLTCVGGTPPASETCNAADDDCDGTLDEGVPTMGPCGDGTGECNEGVNTCRSGSYTCVGARGPTPEVCDGLDNDCDASMDEGNPEGGATCGTMVGLCEVGTLTCTGGALVCAGETGPSPETCDAIDNDCDTLVDEGFFGGSPCGTDLGICVPGTNECTSAGVVGCVCPLGYSLRTRADGTELCVPESTPAGPLVEECNAFDDDCDGLIDEGLGVGGACGSDEGLCMPGEQRCIDGRLVCVGEVGPDREGCDCGDNDCDGAVDEAPEVGELCPPGSACVECQCALPCEMSEFGFTCPTGKTPTVDGAGMCHCVADRCDEDACGMETVEQDGEVLCAPDSQDVSDCVCKNNDCTFPCEGVVCADGTVCDPRDPAGRCVEDNCRGLGCPADQICDRTSLECVTDPCAAVTCGSDEACRGGVCEETCAAVECDAGELCRSGTCQEDRCAAVTCGAGEACDPTSGECVTDLCATVTCSDDEVCDLATGNCVADPCESLHCPGGTVCAEGECVADGVIVPDGGSVTPDAGGFDAGTAEDPEERVLATGGCQCRASAPASQGGGSSGWLLALLVLGALAFRRRRRRPLRGGPAGRSRLARALAVLGLVGALSGCEVEPYCLTCDEGMDAGDGGGMDAAIGDGSVTEDAATDGGLPDANVDAGCLGEELCNEIDDDCDGTVDETIDTDSDVENCGGCGNACEPEGAFPTCVGGVCGIDRCDVGRHDLDGDPANGCEYRCLPTAEDDTICDLRDNDCDGDVDEDIDTTMDLNHCGACGRTCRFAHATARCEPSGSPPMGTCALDACEAGWVDADGVEGTGCEYSCTPTSDPTEICDAVDNDCDTSTADGDADPDLGTDCGSTEVGACAFGSYTSCDGGRLTCTGAVEPAPEMCNDADDDCDGTVDEGNPDGSAVCAGAVGVCVTGRQQCVSGGSLACQCPAGFTLVNDPGRGDFCVPDGESLIEQCNGLDDDCDGSIDEGDPEGGGSCGPSDGACVSGVEHCRGGIVVCEGATGPVAETCDGTDEDCDGLTDEGDPGAGGSCGTDVGTCAPGTRTCTGGALVCTGETGAVAEACDGLDNDCDGTIDEGNPDGGASCGLTTGECTGGTELCLAGTLTCSGGTGPTAESCNGLDDDCDGLTDEGNPGGGASCGSSTGECTSGTNTCTGGAIVCVGGTGPGTETCNALDDDCDGLTDEGNPGGGASCGTAAGACTTGTQSCVAGSLQCTGGVGPAPEACNTVDDDCDGNVDEGNPEGGASCGSSVGACTTGTTTCSSGALVCSGGTSPASETCNGVDDDCDGNVDEGNPGGGASCGSSTGACTTGTRTCIGGALTCTGGTGPSGESCDGADNDCDGMTDEGNPGGGASCGIDTGSCSFGTVTCTGGGLSCVGGTGPTTESCNSSDDDCDGSVDEGNPGGGGLCGTDVGQCSAGTRVCSGGSLICSGATGGSAESCNALDDDCDGSVDEGNPGGGATCGSATGACATGTQLCSGGTLVCSGDTGPSAESCNSIDDDCDSATDEGFDLVNDPSNCGGCGIVCSFANASAGCSGGGCVLLSCDPGFVNADGSDANGCEYMCSVSGAEACNGVDDDCDTRTDEGITPPSNFCNPNGVCSGTSATCGGSSGWTCSYPSTYETPESTCDSLDNDCDGGVDEAFPLVGTSCANGVGQCRRTGAYECNGAGDGTVCNAPAAGTPTAEACNGLDDDCDTALDEGAAGTWVPISGGFGTSYMFAYEASRPDSTSSSAGMMTHRACSNPNRQPWTNLTHAEAEAACAAVGARLCTEEEWQTGCESSSGSCDWSYAASCSTYQPATCNGDGYDFDPGTSGDQDGMLPTASLASCYAGWGGADRIYDMSGNAEEWTAARQPGVNPLRGGSNNDTGGGIRCDFDFVVAGDSIRTPTVGFRCCRSTPLHCGNAVFDGDESDVDCGGSCTGCPAGASCGTGGDCASTVCSGGLCQAPTCTDGVRNGGETDVDCGGGACPACGNLEMCAVDSDCAGGSCVGGRCRSCSPFGTDGYGYVGCSSTPATPPCDDIRATGTPTGLSDDGTTVAPIGFTFDFYGASHTSVTIQANGAITFDGSAIGFGNACLPRTSTPMYFVAPFWDDLNPSNAGSEVYYQTLGAAPNRRFVVQWWTEHYSSTPRRADIRLVLHEGSGDVTVCYADPTFGDGAYDNGASATSGIQGGGDHLQYSCNTTSLTAGLVLDYLHP